jgi:hypothetical protein
MIIVPLFNGEAIFGLDVLMQTMEPSRERQINAFLGINGVECLDFGSRMRTTQVAGRLIGDSPEEVGMYETRFRNYRNAYAYTLLTTEGILWNNVMLDTFAPTGRLMGDPGTQQFWRAYRATFLHLI